MNREDIIGIATKSWLTEYGRTLLLGGFDIEINIEELERFAALVAAAEREACAKVCDEMASRDKLSNYYAVAAKAVRARGNT
jgi:hypothetical protein